MSNNAVEDFLGMQVTQFPNAACQTDPEIFFSSPAKAKSICSQCPHQVQCRDDARARGELFGVFGGETEDERKRFIKKSAQTRYSPIRDLAELGLTVNQIADRLDVQHDSVIRTLSRNPILKSDNERVNNYAATHREEIRIRKQKYYLANRDRILANKRRRDEAKKMVSA